MSSFTLELDDEDATVVVEGLRIQREKWQDILMKKLDNDPGVSAIPLDRIHDTPRRVDELLKRMPYGGIAL